MPLSVQAAAPSLVMPYSLAVAFQQSRDWAVDQNRYPDGSLQSRVIPATSRKRWTASKRLTAAQLADLIDFYVGQGGPWKEFYFYDVYETSPIFSYDETGASSTGRYAVCFVGPLQHSLQLARHAADLSLIEVS